MMNDECRKNPVAAIPGFPIHHSSFIIHHSVRHYSESHSMPTSPPGPRGSLLMGNMAEFRRDRLDFFVRCARTYGDVAAIRLGPRRVYVVSSPALIEEVLVTRSREFIKHFALRLNPLVLGNGLLTSEGDFWLRQRRLIQPAFQKSRIATYASDMIAAANRVLDDWRPGERREILREMERLTLMIAARTLFGAEVGAESRAVADALDFLQLSFLRRFSRLLVAPSWVPTPHNLMAKRAIRQLDTLVYRFIRERRQAGGEKQDLLSILIHARDEEGTRMTDKQLRDEAMTLFLAGHETTALTLTWTWHLLATHPHVEEQLRAELGEVLGGRPPSVADLPRLRYAEQVVQEAMRLFPAAYTVGREALRDMELGGFHVPRGMTLMMPQWVLHRDPRFWDEPETFRPERWTAPATKQRPPFAYFPFGGGPRQCIGNSFAMMESVLVLATIAQRFCFRVVPGHPVEPLATFTLRPKAGVLADIVTRKG
jgi:cytochrome P450